MTIQDLIQSAAAALEPVSDSARLDAEVLLAHALGKTRAFLFSRSDEHVADDARQAFDALLARRAAGEPIAYIVGEREFWSLSLTVTRDTLIPRPDTERLVEIALDVIDAHGFSRIADLGTGSGAIALSIAKERPACSVTATDINPDTLTVARDNAQRLGLSNVEFLLSDWTGALSGRRFDLVVSNPPYVASGDEALATLAYEPSGALESGPEGLDDIRRLAIEAPGILVAEGKLLLEHGFDQGDAVQQLLVASGWRDVRTWRDHSGQPRVTGGVRA
ncbi:MAG: peptide chain release factor N(5)-glutamine methyltransferase [Woeseiaceae bacterium]|nr:peptide chain release factor N(5)-glutamine methyltransferase [Woeseiaceae bacterium]